VTGNEPISNPAKANSPLITIAICTRNRANYLQRAVASVLPQMTDEAELLIVDNASTDETAKITARLAATDSRVKIWRELQPGICAARNAALARAGGEYVLFFDDDELVDAGWLQAYINFFKNPPSNRVGCVGGPYIAQHEVSPPAWMDPNYGGFDVGGNQRILTCGTNLAGGNCAFPRALVCRLGGFDPSLTRYEDSDLNIRLRDAGYELWWLPGARIFHQLPAERLKFGAVGGIAFNEGRSVALLRLHRIHGIFSRTACRLGRMVITPFHLLVCLLAALFTLPRRRGQTSAGYLLRSIRIAGIGWQMLVHWNIAASRTTVEKIPGNSS
jgi:glycosyltransferase involved in cell wall biosynthesis